MVLANPEPRQIINTNVSSTFPSDFFIPFRAENDDAINLLFYKVTISF